MNALCLLTLATTGGCSRASSLASPSSSSWAASRESRARLPMRLDADSAPVSVPCHEEPTPSEPHHVSCAPAVFVSPIIWDVADNLVFRPLSSALGVASSGESVDVNSVDEVPDSSWFENRIGARELGPDELVLGGCEAADLLSPDSAEDGAWTIDHGKSEGSQPGFRITVPGNRRYLIKLEPKAEPERTSAASVIGIAVHHAAGFHTTCEQLLYVRPSIFTLRPGLRSKNNAGDELVLDRVALDKMIADAPSRGGLVRVVASAWLPGHLLGPFRYEGVRPDDPNDVVPHEDRRELRALRVLDAWLARYDSRSGNTDDTWISEKKSPSDASPGHVVHYHLDTSEIFGADSGGDPAYWRREGHAYVIDFDESGFELITLGIPHRPWDGVRKTPGREIFGYFNVEDFVPGDWKPEYPNPAFGRMTERDAAWMTRILARFSNARVRALVSLARFTDAGMSEYLEHVLEGRLARIFERYLTGLSPMTDARVVPVAGLCVQDLALLRGVRSADAFHFSARSDHGEALALFRADAERVCFSLPARADFELTITLRDGVARGPLVVTLHDFGASRGYEVTRAARPPS